GIEEDDETSGPDGLPGPKPGFTAQMRLQRDFLAQFARPEPPPSTQRSAVLREAAAGLPVDAAEVLLLRPGPGPATPWASAGLPASLACVAATLRLFARLMPGSVPESACDDFCRAAAKTAVTRSPELMELAGRCGLRAQALASPVEALQDMVKNNLCTCCVLLESYVGVQEDPATGEEMEDEVGFHCLLVVGGDLLGPTYVTFDPWGCRAGEVSFVSDHAMNSSSPIGFVQLMAPFDAGCGSA
ncbi:unnamed protein product, partial [Effrenium voratum]